MSVWIEHCKWNSRLRIFSQNYRILQRRHNERLVVKWFNPDRVRRSAMQSHRIYFCCNRYFSAQNIGEGRTATTTVLAILVSSLRRCAPEWSCWRMWQTNYWTNRNFQKLSFEFPKRMSSYRCRGQLSLWWYKKQFLRHLHRCQYAAPKKNCCPKISSTFIHEFYGERTERYKRILLELLHRQFYLIVHTHIIVITEIAMVAAVHSNGNCSDIMRRCNINDGS